MTHLEFIQALQALGWTARPAPESTQALEPVDAGCAPATAPGFAAPGFAPALARQGEGLPPALPSPLQALCAAHGGLHNAAQTAWFYRLSDYAPGSVHPSSCSSAGAAFEWDFFERLSLEAALTDADRRAVQQFWQAHVPFAASVAGDYAYLAVRQGDGAVIAGCGPEFEDAAEPVADSLPAFFSQFIAHLTGRVRDDRLLDFG